MKTGAATFNGNPDNLRSRVTTINLVTGGLFDFPHPYPLGNCKANPTGSSSLQRACHRTQLVGRLHPKVLPL